MDQLVWRGETVNGKYLGEVALLTDLSPVVHCETFVDGNWRLWSYVADREQVLQQGKATSLKEAQYICEQTALALQGVQGLQNAETMPMQPMMPLLMTVMPNMQPMYASSPHHMQSQYAQSQQNAYEDVDNIDGKYPGLLQELRFKFRRWAISLTLIGGVFLCIWYSMLLKPVSTIGLLLVLTSIIWGSQALITSFKRPKASTSSPTVDEGITIFSTSQVRPSRRQQSKNVYSRRQPQPQLPQSVPYMAAGQIPASHMPAHQLGYTSNHLAANAVNTNATTVMGIMQAAAALPYQNTTFQNTAFQNMPYQNQAMVQVAPQLQAPQASFYNPTMHMQPYQRSNG